MGDDPDCTEMLVIPLGDLYNEGENGFPSERPAKFPSCAPSDGAVRHRRNL